MTGCGLGPQGQSIVRHSVASTRRLAILEGVRGRTISMRNIETMKKHDLSCAKLHRHHYHHSYRPPSEGPRART